MWQQQLTLSLTQVTMLCVLSMFFFFQAEDGIRDSSVTGVQTCALPISCGQIHQILGDRDDTPIPCWRRAPSLPARASKTTKWLQQFPSAPHVSVTGAGNAPSGDSIDFLDFMAAEEPSEGEIKGCRAKDQPGKNKKLHKKARVQCKPRVVISKPASHTHNASAEGNLRERAKDIHGAERTVAETKNNKEREEINESGQGRGERRTAVLDWPEEELQKNHVQNDIQNKRNGIDDNGSLGVTRGIERRNNQLDGCQGRKPDRVIDNSAGRQASGFCDELAVLEEHADDWFAQDHQAESGRDGGESHDAYGKRESFLERLIILGGRLVRHHRQNGGGNGNGVPAQHQLHDAIRNGESRQTSLWHAFCQNEVGIDKEVDLSDPDSEKSGNHQSCHIPDTGVVERDSKIESHPFAHKRGNLDQKLQDSAYQHAHRQRNCRLFEVMPNRSDGEDDDG